MSEACSHKKNSVVGFAIFEHQNIIFSQFIFLVGLKFEE